MQDQVPLSCTHWCGTAGLVLGLAPRGKGAALSAVPHACLAEGQSAATTPIVLQVVFIFERTASRLRHSSVPSWAKRIFAATAAASACWLPMAV